MRRAKPCPGNVGKVLAHDEPKKSTFPAWSKPLDFKKTQPAQTVKCPIQPRTVFVPFVCFVVKKGDSCCKGVKRKC